eukprot:scaffold10202_cov76-Amphora_coffeaeformis.AAC.1
MASCIPVELLDRALPLVEVPGCLSRKTDSSQKGNEGKSFETTRFAGSVHEPSHFLLNGFTSLRHPSRQ